MCAIILKAHKKYTDRHGVIYDDAYGVVDICNGDKKRKIQHIVLDIYKDSQARSDKLIPPARFSYDITGAEWDDWFSVQAISGDDNQYKQAYEWLHQLEINGELVWIDWESDEEE